MFLNVPLSGQVPPKTGLLNLTAASNTAVGKLLSHGGLATYEPETIAACLALIEVEQIDTFADVGANFGLYSLVVAAVFGDRVNIDAFEPGPDLAQLAEDLRRLNDLRFSVHQLALAGQKGHATLFLSDRSDASNSLNSGFRRSSRQVVVETTTLDSFYHSAVPGLIKMDTETTEPDVIEGGMRLLTEAGPYVVCEVLCGRGEERLSALLDRAGYRAYHLTGEPLQAPSPLRGDPDHIHRDWLFSSKPIPPGFNEAYARWLAALGNAKVQ